MLVFILLGFGFLIRHLICSKNQHHHQEQQQQLKLSVDEQSVPKKSETCSSTFTALRVCGLFCSSTRKWLANRCGSNQRSLQHLRFYLFFFLFLNTFSWLINSQQLWQRHWKRVEPSEAAISGFVWRLCLSDKFMRGFLMVIVMLCHLWWPWDTLIDSNDWRQANSLNKQSICTQMVNEDWLWKINI